MKPDFKAYADGIKEDAQAVSEGRSQCVDGRRLCVDCGRPSRHLEDMRCPRCNQEPEK